MRDGFAKPARADDQRALRLVSCGVPLPGHEVRVVDSSAHELAERAQGRVQFRGPSATHGYYKNPSANAALFAGDWLNTGDLGYFAAGELFLPAAKKTSSSAAESTSTRPTSKPLLRTCPACAREAWPSLPLPIGATAASASSYWPKRASPMSSERKRIAAAITRLTVERIGMPPDDIVLAPPRSVLKTSSGKIRRATARELYEQRALGRTQRAPWWQLTRLVARAVAAQAWRGAWGVVHVAWACWAWAVLVVAAIGAWLTTMLLPGVALRRRAARAWARCALALSGVQVRVEGLEHLPERPPESLPNTSAVLVVANHASYVDSILLTAVLPPRFGYAGHA
jgi:hypothetical protein